MHLKDLIKEFEVPLFFRQEVFRYVHRFLLKIKQEATDEALKNNITYGMALGNIIDRLIQELENEKIKQEYR